MTVALGTQTSQTAALVPRKSGDAWPAVSQTAILAVYAPPSTRYARTSQAGALVPYAKGVWALPRTSEMAALIVYGTGIPGQTRSLAWTYVLDGHTFYVLDLGPEGTFVYDITTQQWSNFETDGYGAWNMKYGCMWGYLPVGADSLTSDVWQLDPTQPQDEEWRDITHTVTGGVQVRSNVGIGCAAVRVTGSIGYLDDMSGASISLSYSDDMGYTWQTPTAIALTENGQDTAGGTPVELVWRSLGSFMAPGRIFKITDSGGLLRIDGCDAMLDDFDNEQEQQQEPPGG